jgi:hypothetical protein
MKLSNKRYPVQKHYWRNCLSLSSLISQGNLMKLLGVLALLIIKGLRNDLDVSTTMSQKTTKLTLLVKTPKRRRK